MRCLLLRLPVGFHLHLIAAAITVCLPACAWKPLSLEQSASQQDVDSTPVAPGMSRPREPSNVLQSGLDAEARDIERSLGVN